MFSFDKTRKYKKTHIFTIESRKKDSTQKSVDSVQLKNEKKKNGNSVKSGRNRFCTSLDVTWMRRVGGGTNI